MEDLLFSTELAAMVGLDLSRRTRALAVLLIVYDGWPLAYDVRLVA